MEVDHDLVVVDEFDALQPEPSRVRVSSKPGSFPAPTSEPGSEPGSAPPPEWSPPHSPSLSAQLKQQFSEKLGKFPAKTHARKVAGQLGVHDGLIFLPGQADKLYEDSDMGPEFRQRRYFYYLSGLDFAGCSVTYDIARDSLTLWIPYIDPKTVLWFGTLPSADDCKARSDVDDVRPATTLGRFLHQTLTPGSTLYVLHPDQAPRLQSTKGIVHINTTELRPAMDEARVVKTDYEVAMIRRANQVSSAAHRAVLTRLRRLTNECEVDAIFRGFCTAQGVRHQAYPVIAGAGANAATLHYWQNDAPLEGRQLMVLDAGAEWDCYASDVTRTMPLNGRFTDEAAAVYRIVQRMQEECIARIEPGLAFYTLHLHASVVAAAGLLELGILHGGTPSDMVKLGTVAAFFPHGLGHHVGLEVHDVSGREKLLSLDGYGSYRLSPLGRGTMGKRESIRPEALVLMYYGAMSHANLVPRPYKGQQKLQKNMVVTVEPGIYFCRDYIKAYFLDNPLHSKYINQDVLEKYYPVGGVRIEDCILVTEDGYENLTSAPKGEEALKIINGSA